MTDGMATAAPPPKSQIDDIIAPEDLKRFMAEHEAFRQGIVERDALIAGQKERIDELIDDKADANKRASDNYDNGKLWRKKAEELEQERASLLDTLHAIEIEKARLEGYIDRTQEFDPQPEPVMVPQQVNRGRMGSMDFASDFSRAPKPWYRRHLG